MSEPGSIRSEVASAGKWSAASTVSTTLIQFVRSIAMAWLLSPAELGLFAMAMLTVNLFRTISDGGMSNAIIYKQTKDRRVLSSIHWVSVAIGLLVSVGVCLGSPLIAAFFKRPELVWVILAIAIGPFLNSWTIVIQAVLRTELRFRSICAIRVAGATASMLVAVITAYNGAGIYAIAYGYVVSAIVELVMCYAVAIDYSRPQLVFQREGLGEYVRFGGYQIGERFINYLGANADYMIIGRVLGDEALGIYRIAFELVVLPLTRINPIVINVVLPSFAKLKDRDRFRRAYLEVIRFLASVTIPCLLGLWAIAPLFIEVGYDARYASAAGLLRILVIVGVFRTLCSPIGVAIISLGRPDIGFYWNLGLTAVSIPVFAIAARFGTETVAWSYAVLMVVSFCLLNGPILSRMLPTTFGDVLRQVSVPMAVSVTMAAVVTLASGLVEPVRWPVAWLLCLIALGAVTYVGLTALIDRDYVRSIVTTLTGRKQQASG